MVADDDDRVRLSLPRSIPVTVQTGRSCSSICTLHPDHAGTRTGARLRRRRPLRSRSGRAGPPSVSRIGPRIVGRERHAEDRGSDTASRDAMRLAPGTDGPAGRQRIAGHQEVVDDAAALDPGLAARQVVRMRAGDRRRSGRAGSEYIRIAGRAALLRQSTTAAPRYRCGSVVPDEDDPAADVDAVPRQPLVVGGLARPA